MTAKEHLVPWDWARALTCLGACLGTRQPKPKVKILESFENKASLGKELFGLGSAHIPLVYHKRLPFLGLSYVLNSLRADIFHAFSLQSLLKKL